MSPQPFNSVLSQPQGDLGQTWSTGISTRSRRTGSGVDFTYCPTWSGMVYVAFVIDAYCRRVLGWRSAGHMRTSLVLDALKDPAARTATRSGPG